MNFLEKLNYLMEKNNLNKNSLSKACNIPYTTIDGWYKKGYEGLKLTTLRKLAKFFNTTLDYWVNDSESNASNASILIDSSINKSSSDIENNKNEVSESNEVLVEISEVAKGLSEDEQLYILDIIKALKQRIINK